MKALQDNPDSVNCWVKRKKMNLKNKLYLNHWMISWQISAVNQILDQVQQTRKVWYYFDEINIASTIRSLAALHQIL